MTFFPFLSGPFHSLLFPTLQGAKKAELGLSVPWREVQGAHQVPSSRVEDKIRMPGAAVLGFSAYVRKNS